jgi:hypothetical protein
MNIDQLYTTLTESFDKGYPWSVSRRAPTKELYYIDLPDGHEIAVNIVYTKENDLPEVEFTSTDYNPDDIFAMTGGLVEKGINPIRVFSSVVEILKVSPMIRQYKGFIMYANKSESSRVGLYKRMLSRFGFKFTLFDNPIYSKSLGFRVYL